MIVVTLIRLILALFLSIQSISVYDVYAQDFVSEGIMVASKSDPASIVKEALLTKAFENAVASYLNQQNFKGDLFLKQYTKKCEESFTATAENLRKDFMKKNHLTTANIGIDTISNKLKIELDKLIRIARYQHNVNFFKQQKLLLAIKSFSEKEYFLNPTNPLEHHLKVEVNLAINKIIPVYDRFINEVQNIQGIQANKVDLSCNITLENISWTDLKGQDEKTVCIILNNYIKKRIPEVSTSYFNEKDIFTSSAEEIRNIEKLFSDELTGEDTTSTSNTFSTFSTSSKSHLWIKVSYNIKQIAENKNIQISAQVAAYDMLDSDKKIVYTADILKDPFAIAADDQSKYTAELVGSLYRSVLPKIEDAVKTSKEYLVTNKNYPLNKRQITVKSYESNYFDIINLQNKLLSLGSAISLKISPHFYGTESEINGGNGQHIVILNVEFRGDEQPLKNILFSLDEQKINDKSAKIKIQDKNNPYLLSIF